MNVLTFGSRFYGGQIDRIDEGFIHFNHYVNNFLGCPDLIYANDASNYNAAIGKWLDWDRKPILIFNVLDCPNFLPSWLDIHETWNSQLNLANGVTCISESVQRDIKNYFNIDATIIYNPVKNLCSIYRENTQKTIPFLYVGRANSPNKRFDLIKQTFKLARWEENILFVVGSEDPHFGQFQGVIDDSKLNLIYNVSKFTLLPSSFEGLGLPAIEAMVCGSIPIICNDNPATSEFVPQEFISEPTPEAYLEKITELHKDYEKYQKLALAHGDLHREFLSGKSVAQRILNIYYDLI